MVGADPQGGRELPAAGHPDQHVHAGARPRARGLRQEGDRDVPRQGLLHRRPTASASTC
ncbi:MAG: hypothetical protein MZV64_11700 [Ignavibacteriales bacterium]|nr:hypothetical protein [Ignavibacteriales bacterium]